MTLAADQHREETLLCARKTRHVGVLGDVRAMPLVTVMRNIEADLVQSRRPVEHLARNLPGESPLPFALRVEIGGGTCHSIRLLFVHLVARSHCHHGAVARILMLQAAKKKDIRTKRKAPR